MLKKVIDIISKEIAVKPEKLREDTSIKTELNIDRADLLNIVTDLEDEYDIIIDYGKLDSFDTILDLNEYVASKI